MPTRGRTKLTDQTCFFVTTTARDHSHYFSEDEKKRALLLIVRERCLVHGAKLHGYVIMSNHMHLLLSVPNCGPGLSAIMRDIKSLSSRKLYPGARGIWQHRFDDVAIYSDANFRTKLNYIHQNPVKAGIVKIAEEYEYSSAAGWLG